MAKIVYKAECDGYMDATIRSVIVDDDYIPDEEYTFSKFSSAKKEVLCHLRRIQKNVRFQIKYTEKIRKKDIS